MQQTHSGALAANPDHSRLYVVHPDADSVSFLDAEKHTILHETLLASATPVLDDNGHYKPAVGPRALALNSTGSTLFVTGQWSGNLYVLDTSSGTLKGQPVFLCSEPIGVVVSADDANVFVACAQDDEVVQVQASTLSIVANAPCPRKPWALAWASDGQTLLSTHLLGPGVSRFATVPLALQTTWALADGPPSIDPSTAQEDPTEPHGPVRGIYDAVTRPGSSELWVAHMMLGIDTPQPALDFQRTVFPSLSILDDGGNQLARLSVLANSGDGGAFGDIVSGPRALAFSDDGKLLFVADADSEDVLVVDAEKRIETQLIRPLPGHMPDGIVFAAGKLFVQERNTEDIAAFSIAETDSGVSLVADGPAFATLSADPMPANLRLGQQLFYSANSDRYAVTQNHWVACATCHVEGRSDAVTWRFGQGPRDTPTNAGGLLDTGFLFRSADRNQVQDYWRTINIEQGGHFSIVDPSQKSLLDALAAFVNYVIPTPVPPSTDAAHAISGQALTDLRARGATVFGQLGCANCHSGPAKTDSGAGNPALDLTGPTVSSITTGGVLLHDVGTCVTTGAFPDVVHTDVKGDARPACAFDTPALRGLWDSAPYLHDGSAATLEAAVAAMLGPAAASGGSATAPSPDDLHALVEFLRGL
jgi:cytochrome c peroxidase